MRSVDGDPALPALCSLFGIDTDWEDIWGRRHAVDAATLRALLGAFDVDLQEGAAEALARAQRAAWSVPLAPVVAIDADRPGWSIELRLPAATADLHWEVHEESTGSAQPRSHRGYARVRELPETASGEAEDGPRVGRRLDFTLALPPGYHRLRIDGIEAWTMLVAAPQRCWLPAALQDGGKVWGPAVQLYALRSHRNWGVGDFSDLAVLVARAAERGAGIVGLNPLHAMFASRPAHASPYSPSSRRFLNVLYIDVEAVVGFTDCEPAQRLVRSPEFQAKLAALRAAEQVDWPGVAAAKFEVLELLWAAFRARSADGAGGSRDPQDESFRAFIEQGGEDLRRHALHESLMAHFDAQQPGGGSWHAWPREFHDPAGAAVADWAARNADRLGLHLFLQWQAAWQLERAARHAQAQGMPVGLYLDLAVSVDGAGSDVWTAQDAYAPAVGIGAPPDDFSPNGQGWGLPPLRPDRLRERRWDLFIDALRANMRVAGALRIDHVMALMRLYWIPPGASAAEGSYVHYARREMLAIVALESQRNQCMVIGEDLGTVAADLRGELARRGVLSLRLLWFEREAGGAFKTPADWPAQALAALGTHDMPTLAAWWSGWDLCVRARLGLFASAQQQTHSLMERAQDRVRLLGALHAHGLLPQDRLAGAAASRQPDAELVEAVHAFVASSPSQVLMLHLEDVIGAELQANLPGTTDQHPNWRHKLPLTLDELTADARWRQLSQRISGLRPLPRGPVQRGNELQARVPRATYRLQLHKDFGFDDAVRILPYLVRLGISHVYCSPVQRARAGSTHGYDVVAHAQVNPELGGQAGLDRFIGALRTHGLGLLLDMVPNHMGVWGDDNAWWMDVLENGPASMYAEYFDIDWQPLNRDLAGKLLVPLLGSSYGDVLDRGELVLRFDEQGGRLSMHYFEHRLPLAPRTYPAVLAGAVLRIEDADVAARLASVSTAFGNLPARDAVEPAARIERNRDKELLKGRLARLAAREPQVAAALAAAVAELNLPQQRDALHALIEQQAWRPAYWRVAADEINYRRFFDIGDLAALRMEREEVFEATQGFALRLAAQGSVDGLRIDHPDGLYDPAQYFHRLQEGYARRTGIVLPDADAAGRPARPLYVLAEKIAAGHEDVPESWALHGTTGYRFANVVNAVMVDTAARQRFMQTWARVTGSDTAFDEVARRSKIEIMHGSLASELNVLASELLRIARADRHTRDYTLESLRRALADVVACMPVYRTYIIDQPSPQDRRYVEWAVREGRAHSADADLSVFDFIQDTILGRARPGATEQLAARVRRVAVRLQQYSSPVAAKGVEDTAFYRWFPLASLNEVGGEPAQFGMSVQEFHDASSDRCRRWPHTMLATSTHDHKRSEDVRNRINVLSEMPGVWRLALRRWHAMNRPVREHLVAAGAPADAPSRTDEYLLYQTLLGTWPGTRSDPHWIDRIVAYMRKAAREAKLRTRWTHPDAAYEDALAGFIEGILSPAQAGPFLADLEALARRIAWFGALSSISTTLVKHTSPGVPDTYQGHEMTALTLVDPDNRRPVDYEALERALDALGELQPDRMDRLLCDPVDGRAKLWVASRLLAFRRAQPLLFRQGDYQPLATGGAHGANLVAYARSHGGTTLVAIAGRLWTQLGCEPGTPPVDEAWGDAWVHAGMPDGTRLRCLLGGPGCVVQGGRIRVAEAYARFPAAALVVEEQVGS